MPECCEVEKLRLQLAPAWTGREVSKFTAVGAKRDLADRFVPNGDWPTFSRGVVGGRVLGITRLGKNLFVQLEGGWQWEGRAVFATPLWHIHLNSTGWFLPFNDKAKEAGPIDSIYANFLHSVGVGSRRLKVWLSDGQVWSYLDSRTWGRWQVLKGGAWDPRTYEPYNLYGPDVLQEPTKARGVLAGLTGTRRTVKDVLTDQYVVAGIGLYLVCEIAHRAGLHPLQSWATLRELDRVNLGVQMDIVLKESLERSDHSHWRVFRRAGKGCGTCALADVKYMKDSSKAKRGIYYCPCCQGEVGTS